MCKPLRSCMKDLPGLQAGDGRALAEHHYE